MTRAIGRDWLSGAIVAVMALLAVVAFTFAIARSDDAPSVTWTTMSRPPGGVGGLTADGGQLVAVGYATDSDGTTTPAVWTSTTGPGWTAATVEDDDEGLMQTAVRFQGDLLAIGSHYCDARDCPPRTIRGLPAVWRSRGEGAVWVPVASAGFDGYARDLATDGERLVLAGAADADATTTGAIWWSTDGETWQRASAMPQVDGLSEVTSFTGGFAVVGYRDAGGPDYQPVVLISTDGDTWIESDLANELPAGDIVSIAATDEALVGIGSVSDATGLRAAAFASSDGLRWTRLPFNFGDAVLELVASGEMGTIIVGRLGEEIGIGTPVAWFTADGELWSTMAHMGPAEENLAIVYATVGRTRAIVLGLSLPLQDARQLAWMAEPSR